MENQHRQISGCRELSQDDIDSMNAIKIVAVKVGELVDAIAARPDLFDQRWVSIGKTDLQTGFMALTRAVAQPTTF